MNLYSVFLLAVCALCFFPNTAMAYIGPGAGLSAIGAFLAILAAILAALFGFIWYPVKRLIRKWRERRGPREGDGPV